MKIRDLLLAFFMISSLGAQQKSFDSLFEPVAHICWEHEKAIIGQLIAEGLQLNQSDSLINAWEAYCGPNEASIRSRLLYSLKFKGAPDTIIPMAYWEYYIGQLKAPIYQSHLQKHLAWSQTQAQQLLNSKDWPEYEEAILKILARESAQGAYESLLSKRLYYGGNEVREIRGKFEENLENREGNGFGLAYNYYWLNASLGDALGALHGLSLLWEYQSQKLSLGLNLGLAFSEQKAYLNFINQGNLETSDLETMLHFDLQIAYEILSQRRSHLWAYLGFGFNSFSTDLSYFNEFDEETYISVSSFYPLTGLDYNIQVYGTRSIGLRSQVQFMNYGRNDELRSSLEGLMLKTSLYFRF